jgi:hypothetical protein
MLYVFLSSPTPVTYPTHLMLFDHPSSIWWEYKCSLASRYFHFVSLNIPLNSLFRNVLNVCWFKVRSSFTHTYMRWLSSLLLLLPLCYRYLWGVWLQCAMFSTSFPSDFSALCIVWVSVQRSILTALSNRVSNCPLAISRPW